MRQACECFQVEVRKHRVGEDAGDKDRGEGCSEDGDCQPNAADAPPATALGIVKDGGFGHEAILNRITGFSRLAGRGSCQSESRPRPRSWTASVNCWDWPVRLLNRYPNELAGSEVRPQPPHCDKNSYILESPPFQCWS